MSTTNSRSILKGGGGILAGAGGLMAIMASMKIEDVMALVVAVKAVYAAAIAAIGAVGVIVGTIKGRKQEAAVATVLADNGINPNAVAVEVKAEAQK